LKRLRLKKLPGSERATFTIGKANVKPGGGTFEVANGTKKKKKVAAPADRQKDHRPSRKERVIELRLCALMIILAEFSQGEAPWPSFNHGMRRKVERAKGRKGLTCDYYRSGGGDPVRQTVLSGKSR